MLSFFHQTDLKLGMKLGLILMAQDSSESNLVFSTILLDFLTDKNFASLNEKVAGAYS